MRAATEPTTPFAFPFRSWSDAERIAREHFGVRAFRPGQRPLIEAVLSGRDAFGILPTGAGKSLCFQLAAMFLPKAVVVVSPLLALMRDQDDKLARLAVPAERLDSTLRAGEERTALGAIAGGQRDVVYVTPEGLERSDVRAALLAKGVSLVVVDEAHCITSWGHDFRPAYLGLADAVRALGRPPVLALTATATAADEREITDVLRLDAPALVRTSVERPNLALTVERTPTDARKEAALAAWLAREPGTILVYATTVKDVERLWAELVARGERAGRYHGELPPGVRAATQEAFMDGRYRVIVATKAFGMGIDKPDVRLVVHWAFPESVETYLQEAGRGGRDGEAARAVLFHRGEDRRVHQFFARGKYASEEEVRRIIEELGREEGGAAVEIAALASLSKVGARKTAVVVHALARARAVAVQGRRVAVVAIGDARGEELVARIARQVERRREDDRARLRGIMQYGETAGCRWRHLREHFGEEVEGGCGRCDRCAAARDLRRAS